MSVMLFWGVGFAALSWLAFEIAEWGKISYRPAPVSWHRGQLRLRQRQELQDVIIHVARGRLRPPFLLTPAEHLAWIAASSADLAPARLAGAFRF